MPYRTIFPLCQPGKGVFNKRAPGPDVYQVACLPSGSFRKLAHAGYAQQSSLAILYRLWNSADRDLCGVDLNIALGACLIADVFTAEECIAKYGFYHDSHHHGRCYPQADSLEPWEWAVVLRGKESLEDLAWAQQFIEGKNIKPEQAGGKFTGFIPYRKRITEESASMPGPRFTITSPSLFSFIRNMEACAEPFPRGPRVF